MLTRRAVSVYLALGIGLDLCTVGRAAAHSMPPRVTQVITQVPADTVVVTTRGILFGDPDAHRWSLLCSDAFGVAVGTPYRVARLPSGRLFVANLGGLRFSDDRGCSWRPHPQLGKRDITSLFQDPKSPSRLYVTVFGNDEGSIRRTEDGGETFQVLYRATDGEFLNSLLVAPSQPQQIYATLSTTDEVSRLFVLRSGDGGATWDRTELPPEADALDVSVLAVNPADPSELLVRVRSFNSSDGDALLRSADGGRTFTELGRYLSISDAAFSGDGATSFVVTVEGLWRASTPERSFVRAGTSDRLTFVSVVDRALLVGGYYVANDMLNVSVRATDVSDPSAVLKRWMSFDEVSSAVTCAAPSTVNVDCALDWIDWSREFQPKTPASP